MANKREILRQIKSEIGGPENCSIFYYEGDYLFVRPGEAAKIITPEEVEQQPEAKCIWLETTHTGRPEVFLRREYSRLPCDTEEAAEAAISAVEKNEFKVIMMGSFEEGKLVYFFNVPGDGLRKL